MSVLTAGTSEITQSPRMMTIATALVRDLRAFLVPSRFEFLQVSFWDLEFRGFTGDVKEMLHSGKFPKRHCSLR